MATAAAPPPVEVLLLPSAVSSEDVAADALMADERSDEEPPNGAPAVDTNGSAPSPAQEAAQGEGDAAGGALSRKRSRGRAGGVLKELKALVSGGQAVPLELPARVRVAPSPKTEAPPELPRRQGSHGGGGFDAAAAAAFAFAEGARGGQAGHKGGVAPQRAGSFEVPPQARDGAKKKEGGGGYGAFAAPKKSGERDAASERERDAEKEWSGEGRAGALARMARPAAPGLEMVGPSPPCPTVPSVHQACRSNNKALMKRWLTPRAPAVNACPPEAYPGACVSMCVVMAMVMVLVMVIDALLLLRC